MNNPVTSREALLAAAQEIIFRDGMSKLNMRNLAAECGIALGSMYGYFPSKTDLVFSVIENFWQSVFKSECCNLPEETAFVDFFASTYAHVYHSFEKFEFAFLANIAAIQASDRKRGKKIERKYFSQIKDIFLHALHNDTSINRAVWTATFTEEAFVSFVISNMMRLLISKEKNCAYLQEIIRRLIYR